MALTEWHDLLARLEQEPESDILAAMLTDELMEARDMNRTEADKYVAKARAEARTVKDIEFVTALIHAKGPAYEHLVTEIRRACGIFNHETITLFVIGGEQSPWTGPPQKLNNPDLIYQGWAVTVPATWARRWHQHTGWAIQPQPKRRAHPGSVAARRRRG